MGTVLKIYIKVLKKFVIFSVFSGTRAACWVSSPRASLAFLGSSSRIFSPPGNYDPAACMSLVIYDPAVCLPPGIYDPAVCFPPGKNNKNNNKNNNNVYLLPN